MFVDTHAHLFFDNFDGEVDQVIDKALNDGIDYILVPSTDLKTSEQVIELTEKYDIVYGAVGVHPHDTKDWDNSWLEKIEELSKHERIVAIGEIGLDYYYDYSPKEKQVEAFKAQIDLALKLDLPIIVHNRDSDDDLMKVIGEYCSSGLKAQFHCFNSTAKNAQELINMNYMISFTGNITFKKADKLRELVKTVGLDHLLLETDSPFMTPVPHRGKRNEPSNIKYIAEKIAEIHQTDIKEVARITSLNAFKLFGVGKNKKTINTYQIADSLYINVTNRCNAHCSFCTRKEDPVIHGYNLGMEKSEEPEAEVYIGEIGDPAKYKEIVFCGYGEPTIRWDVIKEVAKAVKEKGGRTRLNTNGHGNHINKRDITPEFKNLIDVVSVSLNTFDPRQYAKIMGLDTGLYNEMINFTRQAKQFAEKVVMSIVTIDEIDIEKARKIAEDKMGVEFRVREHF
ncbi:MAG: YchF/TatD family DNA exonuclease [Ignavibacteriaceae bacterium]|nr:YchF/TatD family DNA exonuclease [Ignavibacteriaceae bacterium]